MGSKIIKAKRYNFFLFSLFYLHNIFVYFAKHLYPLMRFYFYQLYHECTQHIHRYKYTSYIIFCMHDDFTICVEVEDDDKKRREEKNNTLWGIFIMCEHVIGCYIQSTFWNIHAYSNGIRWEKEDGI